MVVVWLAACFPPLKSNTHQLHKSLDNSVPGETLGACGNAGNDAFLLVPAALSLVDMDDSLCSGECINQAEGPQLFNKIRPKASFCV
jgi:hypothetical protein